MEELFPSEIARLVLGYLKESKCEKSWKVFLEESSNLEEYCHLYKKGKIYPTNVNGQSLLDILREYFILKKKDGSNHSNEFSENTFKEKCKIILEEIVANAVEHVLQKYFSFVCYNREHKDNNSPLDEAHTVHTSKLPSDNCIGYENKATKSGESNTVFINKNIRTEVTSQSFESNVEMNITDSNTVPSDEQSSLPSSSGVVNAMRHNLNLIGSSISDSIYLQEIIKVEKDSDSYSILENSPEKSMPDNSRNQDVNLDEEFNDYTGSEDLHSAENKLKVIVESSPVVDSTTDHNENADKILVSTQVSDSKEMKIIRTIKLERNSDINCDENNTAGTNCIQNSLGAQQDDNSTVEISQTALYSTQSTVSHADNLGNNINFQNNQLEYALQNTPFSNQPVTINDMSFSSVPTYIMPNYSSNGSYMQNNAQYSIVINTPSAWKEATVGGFSLTLPSIHSNNFGPVLTSVDSVGRNDPSSVQTVCVSNTLNPILTAVDPVFSRSTSSVPGITVNAISNPILTVVDPVSSRSTSSVPGISVNAISNPILTTVDTAAVGGQSVKVPEKVANFIHTGGTVCTAPNSNLITNTVTPKLNRKLRKMQTPNEKSSKRKNINELFKEKEINQLQSKVKSPKMATKRKGKRN